MNLQFYKMQGCGNDFLILDYLKDADAPEFNAREIQFFCNRNFGLGADGFVQILPSVDAHAKWNFYNCDGSVAEMCGNAARCVILFLADKYFPDEELISLETKAGIIRGKVFPHERYVEVMMMPGHTGGVEVEEVVVKTDETAHRLFCVNTGVPHAVVEVEDLKNYPVTQVGRSLLHHPIFGAEGSNITFFEKVLGNKILSTTFERGVEEETLACGTGAAAAAIVYSQLYLQAFPIEVTVPGGTLAIDFSPVSKYMLLRGPAEYVMQVELPDFPPNFETPQRFGKDSRR